jgi:hypothetical protein
MMQNLSRVLACIALGMPIAGMVLADAPFAGGASAEPLVTQGIGTSNCAQLAGDLNPSDGLYNPINVMLYAWVQGYLSAANISLLEDDSKHVDLSTFDDAKVIGLIQGFCKANPDKKTVVAIDELIRKSAKIKTKWESGTIDWDE